MTDRSRLNLESDRNELGTCAHCGERIDATRWHPIVTRVTGDGNVRLVPYCDDTCRDARTDT